MQGYEGFQKIEHCILSDTGPGAGLRLLAGQPWFGAFPFSMLLRERDTPQSPVHHPEGDVWAHTLLVVEEAADRKRCSSDPRSFMWAALLHDIGKPETTAVRRGRITAYNHDREGAALARRFLAALTGDAGLIDAVAWLVRYHMQILYVTKSLPYADIPGMQRHTNVNDVALLGYCDRLGRKGADPAAERRDVFLFLQKCGGDTALPWL